MKTPIRSNSFWTLNLEVASMLVTLGFKFKKDRPGCRQVDAQGRARNMMFLETEAETEDFGRLSASECLKAWKAAQEGESCKMQTEHPEAYRVIEYMAVYAINRLSILHTWKTCAPLMVEQNIDGDTLTMPADASPDLIRRVEKMIADS